MTRYLLTGIALIFFAAIVYAANQCTCYRYVNSKATGGFVKVWSDSKEEAEAKAVAKYRNEMGYEVDYCECRY